MEETRRLREPAALAALVATLLIILAALVELLVKVEVDEYSLPFAVRSTTDLAPIFGFSTLALPLVAILLTTHAGGPTPRARLMTIIALVAEGIGGLISLVALIGTVFGTMNGSFKFAYALLWLGMLVGYAMALYFAVVVLGAKSMAPVARPQRPQPGFGGPYPGQGYGQPGQPAGAMGPPPGVGGPQGPPPGYGGPAETMQQPPVGEPGGYGQPGPQQPGPYGGQPQGDPYGGPPQGDPYGGQQQPQGWPGGYGQPSGPQQPGPPQGDPYGGQQQPQGWPGGYGQPSGPQQPGPPQGDPYGGQQQPQGWPGGYGQPSGPQQPGPPQGDPYGGQQQPPQQGFAGGQAEEANQRDSPFDALFGPASGEPGGDAAQEDVQKTFRIAHDPNAYRPGEGTGGDPGQQGPGGQQ